MKYASFLCLISLMLLAATCKKSDKLATALVNKTWLHSFEEDSGDTVVYRPNTFDFPPSRGRTGFTLESGGVIKRYEIAPADGLEEQTGVWEQLTRDRVQIRMQPGSNPPQAYEVQILSLEGEVLKVRRLSQAQVNGANEN
ncbi:hypothetical protein MKJ04_09850 [Pontibacter sp. E15-1]|uniref:hypothetical protein n=1 Tax=Pontibacter sp. E15-1 TaxID=2919918 RepID=UPI001F4F9A99|nr:hypothetical protein [Pontibacter sp. E15-1]MCJ8165144.1 hypothetical protein [Pontibacter sp. E15-1]